MRVLMASEMDEQRAFFRTLRKIPPKGYGDGDVVCARCVVADSFWLRLRGLMLRRACMDAALWPGSFSEWVADPAHPVAVGEEPG